MKDKKAYLHSLKSVMQTGKQSRLVINDKYCFVANREEILVEFYEHAKSRYQTVAVYAENDTGSLLLNCQLPRLNYQVIPLAKPT